jgi:hypothetical protein
MQVQQHALQQQLITRLLIAQSGDEAEHVKLVSRVLAFFGDHGQSMGVMMGVVCRRRTTGFARDEQKSSDGAGFLFGFAAVECL